MTKGKPSLAWPHGDGPTKLSVDDITGIGGGAALRSYITARLLAVDAAEPGTAASWSRFAVEHLRERAADQTEGGAEVSTAALQMALAYMAWLETVAVGGAA